MTWFTVSEVKWEIFRTSCYYMPTIHTPKTQNDVDATCQSLGAHVAAPETAEENQIILMLLSQSGKGVNCKDNLGSLWLSL